MNLFEEEGQKPKIILLDYQATLVANFNERQQYLAINGHTNYSNWIAQERYRAWIPELIKKEGVLCILITARPYKYRAETIQRIKQLLGWEPDECYFNESSQSPDKCKKELLEKYIYPRHGRDAGYLAFESNEVTRRMYAKEGIMAIRVGDIPLSKLPLI